MAASDRSTKDKAMASYLKKHGVVRTVQRCPMCHRAIPVNSLQRHLTPYCRG